jgi:hypothetical protein
VLLQKYSASRPAVATMAMPSPNRVGSSSAAAPTLNISISAMPGAACGSECSARVAATMSIVAPTTAWPRGARRRCAQYSSATEAAR